MNHFVRWYSGWIWQDVGALDALVLWPPLSPPDDPAAFARELYHRYLPHLIAIRLWRYEWLAIGGAGVVMLLLFARAALAAIGDRLQPIFFTHHRHVLEIAQSAMRSDVAIIELG